MVRCKQALMALALSAGSFIAIPAQADKCVTGTITTAVGGGIGDGAPAVNAALGSPVGVALGKDGTIYIADKGRGRIRKVTTAGVMTTVAGGGSPAQGVGDDGPAVQARLSDLYSVTMGPDGSLYVAEEKSGNRIRKIDPNGVITTVAGTGEAGYAGDGGPATAARLNSPRDVALGRDGSLYIADRYNNRIRRVDPAGIITTVAGNGEKRFAGDGGPATAASLAAPDSVTVGPDGSLYIADTSNARIRKVDPAGIIATIAGNGKQAYGGDGGPAIEASMFNPCGVKLGADGSIYIAEGSSKRIRKVDPAGIITTFAGKTEGGYCGDGGPATAACLGEPKDIALATDGSVYIADSGSGRVRKVDPAGIITTVAGNGNPAYCGDGGPATQASLQYPTGIAFAPDGSFYISDTYISRIRKVDMRGVISTFAGSGDTGRTGHCGDI
jgi:glucose/arabinose dehydrogenase